MSGSEFTIGDSGRWASDGKVGTHGSCLFQPSANLSHRHIVFDSGGLKPAGKINGGGNLQAAVVDCPSDLRQRSTCPKMRIDMIVPEFDRRIACCGSDFNLLQDGGGGDRTGIQTIAKS